MKISRRIGFAADVFIYTYIDKDLYDALIGLCEEIYSTSDAPAD